MTPQEIAASVAELQANKRRAALENKPELCEGYQRAIDLLEELAELKRREQCRTQKTPSPPCKPIIQSRIANQQKLCGDKCCGYGKSEYDDEPIDACKQCEKQASYEED